MCVVSPNFLKKRFFFSLCRCDDGHINVYSNHTDTNIFINGAKYQAADQCFTFNITPTGKGHSVGDGVDSTTISELYLVPCQQWLYSRERFSSSLVSEVSVALVSINIIVTS